MTDVAIRVDRLGKRYQIGQLQQRHDTLRDVLASAARNAVRRASRRLARQSREENAFWALRDVSFEVARGEVVGIIGANGAGKSTLLKILSRITEPTRGEAVVRGRVGSLLEVGTGFHGELSGRENIYLNGAILGMKRVEIERKFDEIVAFAGVERFIDTPVKHYSSGMYLRLAFAVAAHLEPEILIVDEVLAVGDASFQKKCLGKMNSVAREGRTVLFVSHNLPAVEDLCGRVLWLNNGEVALVGSPREVVSTYRNRQIVATAEQQWEDPRTAPGNDLVRLHRTCVRPVDGSSEDTIDVRTPFVIEIEYWKLKPGNPLTVYLHLYNDAGMLVFNIGNVERPILAEEERERILLRETCHVPGDLLNDGLHTIQLHIAQENRVVFSEENAVAFQVHDSPEISRGGWYGKWAGAIRPRLRWHTDIVEEAHSDPNGDSTAETGSAPIVLSY